MKAIARLHERLDGRERKARGFMAQGYARDRPRGPLPPGIAPKRKTNPRSALESAQVLKNEPKTNPNEPNRGAPALEEVLLNQHCFERLPRTNPKRTQEVIRLTVCVNCLQKCGLDAIPIKRAELRDRAAFGAAEGYTCMRSGFPRPSSSRCHCPTVSMAVGSRVARPALSTNWGCFFNP
jgi:hypothetical protein